MATSEMDVFDKIRAEEFPQLYKGDVYADWTGAALPPNLLLDRWCHYHRSNIFGNPHSCHAPSALVTEQITRTRRAVLDYFNASPDEYEVIFTSGATAAILHLQHFLFEGGELLLTADNHNSVNGLREIAKRSGAVVRYAPIKGDLTIDEAALTQMLSYPRSTGHKLFCYPAKSNYAGTMHSLEWVRIAREKGWSVLLDAAAYAANSRLDLGRVKPDFVPISFYKLFGFPTGVGCLIIRKEAYARMHKKWFAGGSILFVGVKKDLFVPEPSGYARFEDGTVNFGQIPAIMAGLEFMEYMMAHGDVRGHAIGLATMLYDELCEMREGQGSVVIHSARGNDTVTFSVKKENKIVDAWLFEQAVNAKSVYVRTGCFCNPGVNEKVFGYAVEPFEALYDDARLSDKVTMERLRELSGDAAIGAIRASFGYANNRDDVSRLVAVTRDFLRGL